MIKGMKVLSKMTMLTAMMAASFNATATTNWDLPLAWPADNYIVKSVDKFSQQVETATKGELVITLHPGGSLGFKGPEMFYAVGDGLVMIGDM